MLNVCDVPPLRKTKCEARCVAEWSLKVSDGGPVTCDVVLVIRMGC